jgi:hypothetical protein
MSGEEGMRKTIEFLKEVVIKEKPAEIYWA